MKIKMYGIDVSHWQGDIDFNKVAETGIKFVMIKIGGYENDSKYFDDNFSKNYHAAKNAGLHIGCYIYIGESCNSVEKALSVAHYFANMLDSYPLDMPLAIDVEEKISDNIIEASAIIRRMCENLEYRGFYVSIYGSEKSTFDSIISSELTKSHDRWIAKYAHIPPRLDCGMWQFSSRHEIDGINGYVDINACYKDYPSIIAKMKERTTK